jgi:hypothetical protein
MSDYIYTSDGELYHADELYHYGVPGMKWGKRKARYEARTTRKLSRAGRIQGQAQYHRDKSAKIVDSHNRTASVLDKQAKTYEKKGGYIKAELTRRAASAIRKRGLNASASSDQLASYYENRAKRLVGKADKYASKKHVSLGKSRVNSIMKDSKKKGYELSKRSEDYRKEQKLREKLGDKNYSRYNRIRGKK